MSICSEAVDDLFADPNLGLDAVYRAGRIPILAESMVADVVSSI